MRLIAYSLISLYLSLGIAYAAEKAEITSQWKTVEKHFFDYVGDGYSMISHEFSVLGDKRTHFYFLQKGKSIVRCTEISYSGGGSLSEDATSKCSVLVAPYWKAIEVK
ncbi:MAG: hypothetical protein AAB276_01525 [Pseudomonadota bacterium]